jgi:hypothetical protein
LPESVGVRGPEFARPLSSGEGTIVINENRALFNRDTGIRRLG